MSDEIENPFVYPLNSGQNDEGMPNAYDGITLRDHYAGLALEGLVREYNRTDTPPFVEMIAASSYRIADAMLKERMKK